MEPVIIPIDGDSEFDCGMLRARIIELEATLSASKQPIPMTPTTSTHEITRSSSVMKLVDALNKAAHEVETPKPWPSQQSMCSADILSSQAKTLSAIDQSIKRFKKSTSSSTSTALYSNAKLIRRPDNGDGQLLFKSDEFQAKMEAKDKQIVYLTSENIQLKAKVTKLKQHLKASTTTIHEMQCVSPSGENVAPVVNSNSSSRTNSGEVKRERGHADVVRGLSARLDELRSDAESKLTAAAVHVEEQQRLLDLCTRQSLEKDAIIVSLQTQLQEAIAAQRFVEVPIEEETERDGAEQKQTEAKEAAARGGASTSATVKTTGNHPSSLSSSTSIDTEVQTEREGSVEEEMASMKRKFEELTKVYNESCRAQSEMKVTMGQAVGKLKQFIKELEEKSAALALAHKENDHLKASLSVLERGVRVTMQAVEGGTDAHGDMDSRLLGMAMNGSCILANSYQSDAMLSITAAGGLEEQLLLDANSEHHRLAYLRQAFTRMFHIQDKGKGGAPPSSAEMQNLGRVMCSLLGIEGRAQKEIVDALGSISTAAAVSSSLFNVLSIFD